jgi:hypothetical protein
MKNQKPSPSKQTAAKKPSRDALQLKVTATEKNADKAWEVYKKKAAIYEDALKKQVDKLQLKTLLTAAKIAKYTYKIKNLEHKLARLHCKAASKASKKKVEKVEE